MTTAPTDLALLDTVQRQTLRYFWDFAHPACGLARERSNAPFDYGPEVVATGGTGFGGLGVILRTHRGWIRRDAAAARLLQVVRFLWDADAYHGVFPHFLNGDTGKTVRFMRKDDGGDIVETSFLMAGLLWPGQYFAGDAPAEADLRRRIEWLWNDVEWRWHTKDGTEDVLY